MSRPRVAPASPSPNLGKARGAGGAWAAPRPRHGVIGLVLLLAAVAVAWRMR
jgi:hypothetical protein